MGLFYKSTATPALRVSVQAAVAKAISTQPPADPAEVDTKANQITKDALAAAPNGGLDMTRVLFTVGLMAILVVLGMVEAHNQDLALRDRFLGWAEKVFFALLALFAGESAGRKS